ncbi:MAG: PHP domain-containing protein [Bacilli bacterium]|nr:PHP domain-containing protein [Bacilli bacterium]
MMKTNYHNHTFLCGHAQGLPIDYIRKAVELGYEEIGMSDHGPLWNLKRDARMDLSDFYDIYLPNLESAITVFSSKIKIYKGLEIEYFNNQHGHYEILMNDLDYLILGQHYFVHQGRFLNIYNGINEELLLVYQDRVIEALNSGYFKILAHPDIFLFDYQTWNQLTEKVSRNIIEAAISNQVFLEINVNGIRRKNIVNQDGQTVYIYPRIEFWTLLQEYPQAKIMINEDNHTPIQMGDKACLRAREFAEELNLKVSDYLFGDKHA